MRLRHFPLPIKNNTKSSSSLPRPPTLERTIKGWWRDALAENPGASRNPPPGKPCGSVPAARVAGGGAGRAARLGAGRRGAGERVVGGEHHAARVLHFHRQPRMSRRPPENKGGDQHGPAPGPRHQRGGRARAAPGGSLRAVRAAGPARGAALLA